MSIERISFGIGAKTVVGANRNLYIDSRRMHLAALELIQYVCGLCVYSAKKTTHFLFWAHITCRVSCQRTIPTLNVEETEGRQFIQANEIYYNIS